jgi:hypothetical protein
MPPDRPTPQLRASDADRDKAAQRLREAAVEGRLDSDELEQRIGDVYSAKWLADLDRLTADVTPLPPPDPAPLPAAPPPPHCYAPYPIAQTTNGLAVAALISSLVGFGLFGVIFGHVSLKQIKESQGRQSGEGLAIAGLAIGYLEIAFFALIVLIALGS